MRLRRTTAHEIDFALPLISGKYLSVVLPGATVFETIAFYCIF